VSDQKTCPACRVRSVEYPTTGGIVEDRSCTGRAGCVRHPNRENPAPESAPARADVPVGKADIVERLRDLVRLDKSEYGGPYGGAAARECMRAMTDAADAIARLRAEVERLNGDALVGADPMENGWEPGNDVRLYRARITELMAEVEKLSDPNAVHVNLLRGSIARPTWEQIKHVYAAEAEADHAALATRVAEAVREACKRAVTGTYGDARNHHRMGAINLAAVLAGVTGEEG
jgi:hypothetical protein